MWKSGFIFVVIFIWLAGCAVDVDPRMLGISNENWARMSQQEREKVLNNYYQIQSQQQSPVTAMSNQHTVVKLDIYDGAAIMPPFISASFFKPAKMVIREGNCNTVPLRNRQDSRFIEFKACYYDKVLYLDPSRYELDKRLGSTQLVYSPIWQRGFTYYGVKTSGYARIRGTSIYIQQFDGN